MKRPLEGPSIRLAAVGDVSLSGRLQRFARDRQTPVENAVMGVLREADLTFGNLENVVAEQASEGPFRIEAGHVLLLRDMGFSVLNLANNHALDRGAQGLEETVGVVESSGITVVGAARDEDSLWTHVRTDRGDLAVGWLAGARTASGLQMRWPRICELDELRLTTSIRRARAVVDVVVVSIHAGFMLVEYPAPDLRTMAQRLAAAGADLILMHHPHVLQGIEVTAQGSVICYSLGNFLFDWREGHIRVPIVEDLQRQGGLFLFELDRRGVASAKFQPTILDDDCRAVRPPPSIGAEICRRVAGLSDDLGADYERAFSRQRAERNTALGVRLLVRQLLQGRIWDFVRSLGRLRPRHALMAVRWITARFRPEDDA